MSATPPQRVFIFDMTRHRSHLFFRYLSTHPQIGDVWHPFLPAYLNGPERITLSTRNEGGTGHENEVMPTSEENLEHTYQNVTRTFLKDIDSVEEQGKLPVANEHCQMVLKPKLSLALIRNEPVDFSATSNPTVIPDDVYESLTPIFVIRNPVFSVPSNYRTLLQISDLRPGGEDWKLVTMILQQRRLFDHFRARLGRPPTVVDGDDVVWRTKDVQQVLSKALHLKPEGFSATWQAVPEDQRSKDPVVRHFLQAIDDSTGIERSSDRHPDGDVQKAHARWQDEFGKATADQLRATVEDNMPHYEHMAQFKT